MDGGLIFEALLVEFGDGFIGSKMTMVLTGNTPDAFDGMVGVGCAITLPCPRSTEPSAKSVEPESAGRIAPPLESLLAVGNDGVKDFGGTGSIGLGALIT
jgi:hypothetical protein